MEQVVRHAHAGDCIAIRLPDWNQHFVGEMGPPTYSR
jgi:hypothetical protein